MIPRNIAVTYYLASEYHKLLKGAILDEVVYRRSDKTFVFVFTVTEKRSLHFSFAPPKLLLLTGSFDRSGVFPIWQEVHQSQIGQISAPNNNRVIDIHLSKVTAAEAESKYRVRFELFGPLTNAFLLDEDNAIVHSTRVVSDRRELRPGQKYIEPPALPQLPPAGQTTVATTEAAEYVLHYRRHQHRVLANVKPGKMAFRPDNRTPLISLFQQLSRGVERESIFDTRRERLRRRLNRELERLRRRLEEIESRLEACTEAKRLKQRADILMANPHADARGDSVRLHDFYSDHEVEIPLLAGKNVIQTAAAYYKRAKKLERAPASLRRRRGHITQREVDVLAALRQLNEVPEESELTQLEDRWLPATKRSKAAGETGEGLPYRTYYTRAGEKIMVGRSATANDELTFKIARTYDLWFHTQQSKGSHVILEVRDKNRRPSRESIETAAAVAAYFSDERHGSHVPVIYTQRRNVRKARKGPPGLVIPQQVESVFVDPGRPDEPEDELTGD
jgi:predicted ribosome quality control (RQC) complex YloA/Tae2 family protein